jgi:TPR repeat protein
LQHQTIKRNSGNFTMKTETLPAGASAPAIVVTSAAAPAAAVNSVSSLGQRIKLPTLLFLVLLCVFGCAEADTWVAPPMRAARIGGLDSPEERLAALAFATAQAAYAHRDYATAFGLWLPLAQQGNAIAQENIAWMYAIGEGVTRDYEKAYYWYLVTAYAPDNGIAREAQQGAREAAWHLDVDRIQVVRRRAKAWRRRFVPRME